MIEEQSFADLIRRVRAGDQEAATQLVREYEPEIRRAVRLRLTDRKLTRVLDSMDICQSVLANFFVRAAAGQFDIERPDQVLRLLVTMARNRLLDQARRQKASRRDNRRTDSSSGERLEMIADQGPTPSEVVSERELLAAFRARLSDEERALAEQRAQGRDWAEIAADLGGSPEALRKRLSRALDRVTREMGLSAADED
jgi:RNA polymerase sigma-70 factor (ECF subfamily)